jgi:hypothetical protein
MQYNRNTGDGDGVPMAVRDWQCVQEGVSDVA